MTSYVHLSAMPYLIAISMDTYERGIFTTQVKRYIRIVILLQLENKQQSMPKKVETQHKHMYSFYFGSLCNMLSSHRGGGAVG